MASKLNHDLLMQINNDNLAIHEYLDHAFSIGDQAKTTPRTRIDIAECAAQGVLAAEYAKGKRR